MITFKRKIEWDELPKMGMAQADIKQLTWRPGPFTDMEFNDPAKEAELQAETDACLIRVWDSHVQGPADHDECSS